MIRHDISKACAAKLLAYADFVHDPQDAKARATDKARVIPRSLLNSL
jgi:hypothetical protein